MNDPRFIAARRVRDCVGIRTNMYAENTCLLLVYCRKADNSLLCVLSSYTVF